MSDVLMRAMFEALKVVTDPLNDRIRALEAQLAAGTKSVDVVAGAPGERGAKGDPGADGADGRVGVDGAPGPVGPQGEKGLDGADGAPGDAGPAGPKGDVGDVGPAGPQGVKGDTGDVGPVGADGAPGAPGAVGPQGPAGPAGDVGAKGADGVDGKDGAPGAAFTVDMLALALVENAQVRGEVETLLAGLVDRHLKAHPPAAGADGAAGRDGVNGVDGKDGVGVAGAVVAKDGALVLTLSNGETKELGVVVGTDGQPGPAGVNGKDGADGLGFDDLSFEFDDRGRLYLRFARSEVSKRVRVPGLHFQEVFKAGTEYVPGDTVQWGGDMYVARAEGELLTPGTGAAAAQQWRMAVRRGREGAKGLRGDVGPKGDRGDKGEQGPAKW